MEYINTFYFEKLVQRVNEMRPSEKFYGNKIGEAEVEIDAVKPEAKVSELLSIVNFLAFEKKLHGMLL